VGLPRLTTGCSGRRCAPPLNRSVRPLGGYRPDWIRESELTGAFAGGFFGALFALLAGILLDRRSEKRKGTQEFINEYFSSHFLSHRVGVSMLRRKLLKEDVTVRAMAAGYWYPREAEVYSGDSLGDFNEHQHLEAYFGISRPPRTCVRPKPRRCREHSWGDREVLLLAR
jgi:hypothetical protein